MSLFNNARKNINDILNLQCDICGKAYFTNFTRIKYCDECINDLEKELENGIPEN
jgi:uncharacterized OB-fold protein